MIVVITAIYLIFINLAQDEFIIIKGNDTNKMDVGDCITLDDGRQACYIGTTNITSGDITDTPMEIELEDDSNDETYNAPTKDDTIKSGTLIWK